MRKRLRACASIALATVLWSTPGMRPGGGCALGEAEQAEVASRPVDRSPLQLCGSPDGSRLYTANRTANSVSVIAMPDGRVVQEIAVQEGPTSVAVSPDGAFLYAANRLADTVSVVDLAAGQAVAHVPVANQPYDLVVGPDGTVHVSCVGKDEVVQTIDPGQRTVTRTIPVDQNPRHLALSPDGALLLVGCDAYETTRFIDVIDLASGTVRNRVELPMVSNIRGIAFVRPGLAIVAHLKPNPFAPLTQVQQGWVNTSAMTFLNLEAEPIEQTTLLLDGVGHYEANPFDVGITPDGRLAYIACGGADRVLAINLPEAIRLIEATPKADRDRLARRLDLSGSFIAARIPVGTNPYGIAVAPDGSRVYVANHLGNSVSVIDPATQTADRQIDVGSAPELTPLRRGEILFNSAAICFQEQFSCASCHPEGHTTGLSWDLEDDGLGNPKSIKSFLGVGGTGPFRWQGEAPEIGLDECAPTVTGAMRGAALSPEDLAALEAYVTNLPLWPNPYLDESGNLSPAAERGKAVFDRKARCRLCHRGPALTIGQRFDVGTGEGRFGSIVLPGGETIAPTEFDVPHLLGAWDSPPYLHDGRAKTLHEIFTIHNPQGLHGNADQLSPEELDDLIEYLKAL